MTGALLLAVATRQGSRIAGPPRDSWRNHSHEHTPMCCLKVSSSVGKSSRGAAPIEVVSTVGFYDLSQMNRQFKRILGMTPREFVSSCGRRRVFAYG